jgi:hypothetical protein
MLILILNLMLHFILSFMNINLDYLSRDATQKKVHASLRKIKTVLLSLSHHISINKARAIFV